jgi:hypothetical protein
MKINKITLTLVNLLAFLATVVVNYLSATLPLNGKTPGQLSDFYPNLFVPAGFTFSIWGVIYLFLTIWIVGQLVNLFRKTKPVDDNQQAIGWLFLSVSLLNIAWLFAWHWRVVFLSVLIMVTLLYELVHINKRMHNQTEMSGWLRWVAFPAFGIYMGWITIALIANMTAFLVSVKWNSGGVSQEIWTMLMIGIGSLLAFFMTYKKGYAWHGVAVVWALFGIYSKRTALADAPMVGYLAIGLAGLIGVVSLWRLVRPLDVE